jgi:hypothetical protein
VDRPDLSAERVAEIAASAKQQIEWCASIAAQLVEQLPACADDGEREYVLAHALSLAMQHGVGVGLEFADSAFQRVVLGRSS